MKSEAGETSVMGKESSNFQNNKKRELWVDYTKLFACLLVVIGHLLQGLNTAKITWNYNLYFYIDIIIYIFHMPLFMCMSGYLYGKYTKINSKEDYFKFSKKKIINLAIPYFVFYALYVFLNMIFSSSVNSQKGIQDLLNCFTNPISPFWFLYALLFIFLFTPILEKVCKKNLKNTTLLFIIFHIINIFFKTNIYFIDRFLQYGLFFYIGVILSKKELKKVKTKTLLINIAVYIAISIAYTTAFKNKIIDDRILSIIKSIIAVYGILISVEIFKKASNYLKNKKIFNLVSKYTFQIYLMHTIFSAGVRIALIKIGIENFYIHFILGLFLGIIGPMIIAKILEATKYGNLVVYPLNTIAKIKEKKNENCNDRA